MSGLHDLWSAGFPTSRFENRFCRLCWVSYSPPSSSLSSDNELTTLPTTLPWLKDQKTWQKKWKTNWKRVAIHGPCRVLLEDKPQLSWATFFSPAFPSLKKKKISILQVIKKTYIIPYFWVWLKLLLQKTPTFATLAFKFHPKELFSPHSQVLSDMVKLCIWKLLGIPVATKLDFLFLLEEAVKSRVSL